MRASQFLVCRGDRNTITWNGGKSMPFAAALPVCACCPAAHARIRDRFRLNDLKCQIKIESRENVRRRVSMFPLQITERRTVRLKVRRTNLASETHRG